MMGRATILLCSALAAVSTPVPLQDNEKTLYFNQTVDHFNAETKGVWLQRYYVNTTYFKKPTHSVSKSIPPLFFIPGGEWSVGPNKGILYGMAHELAEQHGGLMAIAEHRFYGESLPFGNESFVASSDRIGLLTIEQSMADYALIIKSILEEYGIPQAPVVALGGSYSGKLSAYMRLKYPFLISMALASSAPIYLDSVGMTSQYAYYDVVERATTKIRPACPAVVKAAFEAYAAIPSPSARQDALGLCSPVPAPEFGWDELEFYIVQYFATMAMFNYPPSSSNLARACDHVLGTTPAATAGDGNADTDADNKNAENENATASPLDGFKRLLAVLRPGS
jgi:pimeloyl-ACP methyl ester carboxylesterase